MTFFFVSIQNVVRVFGCMACTQHCTAWFCVASHYVPVFPEACNRMVADETQRDALSGGFEPTGSEAMNRTE